MKWEDFASCTMAQEYELFTELGDVHLRNDQIRDLLHDSFYLNLHTVPILEKRRELPPEQWEDIIDELCAFVQDKLHYHYFNANLDFYRLYGSYCWMRYKQGKPVYHESSLFCQILHDTFFKEKEVKKEDSQEIVESVSEEKEQPEPVANEYHLFSSTQNEHAILVYKETVLARHYEHLFKKNGCAPDPVSIEESLKERLDREEMILRKFFEAGRNEPSLSYEHFRSSFAFSFYDDLFCFFFGKMCFEFNVRGEDFYLGNEKVDLSVFFSNLHKELFATHKQMVRIGKTFEKVGYSYSYDDESLLFFHRHRSSDDVIYIRFQKAEMKLRFSRNRLFRLSGEVIYQPEIIVSELLEKSRARSKAVLKAKHFLKSFLTKVQKDDWIKKKSFMVKGKEYDYLFCPNSSYNSIVRISKETGEKKALCVKYPDPLIPRHDLLATSYLLIKSGKEEMLNSVANEFDLENWHERLLQRHVS